MRLDQITAGLSNTLLLGEQAGEFRPWGCPWNWRVVEGPLNGGPGSYGHDGRGETDFVLMDGEVKAFNNDVDPEVLVQLASGGLLARPEDVARPPIPAGYPTTEVRHQYAWPRKGDAWIPPADDENSR